MAAAKKDQERVIYDWMYGCNLGGTERRVTCRPWLQGFDGQPAAGAAPTTPVATLWKQRSTKPPSTTMGAPEPNPAYMLK